MNLDIGTIVFLTCLITFTMGAILFVVSRTNPAQINGVKEWAWSCVLQGIAWVLLAERGQISDFMSIVAANTILVATVTMQFQAILKFKEKESYGLKLFIPTVISFFLVTFFTYINPDIAIRTTIVTLMCICFCFLSGHFFLFRQKHPILFSEWLLGIVFLLVTSVLLVRFFYIWFYDAAIVYLYSDNQMQGIIFSIICIADILLTFSFALMMNERFREEILRLAKIDPLTEVFNRAAMEQMFKSELRRASRYRTPVTFLMLDLDYFKAVNDTYGHQVGDKTLKIFVNTINEQLRTTDIFSRYGGEEFALLLPDSDINGAKLAAERLCRSVADTEINTDGFTFKITVSIGIADFRFDDDDLDKMVNRADIALYRAKQNGRNQIRVFEDNDVIEAEPIINKLKLVT